MKKEVNECCDCAVPGYPCRGDACPNRHVVRFYCDMCGEEIDLDDGLYDDDGKDICLDCLKEKHKKDF